MIAAAILLLSGAVFYLALVVKHAAQSAIKLRLLEKAVEAISYATRK